MNTSPGRRQLAALLLTAALLFTGCQAKPTPREDVPRRTGDLQSESLSAAVVRGPGDGWRDTFSALENSTLANLTAAVLTAEEPLSGYDLVIPDPALAEGTDWPALRDRLMDYARSGGFLVLDNSLWDDFPSDFLGIAGAEALTGPPVDLSCPEGPANLADWRQLLLDFAALYPAYYNAADLASQDYGVGFHADGAQVLAEAGGLALYTLSQAGEGQILLTNPLLPNGFSITDASLEASDPEQAPFANTSAGANRLFYGKLLAYLSMERFGYALERVYGSFGTNPLAWELHYEDITAIAHGACYQFAALAEEAGQIPSFSLVRSPYWWFLRAESVTYLTGGTEGFLDFAMDEVENAYSSGTHVVSGEFWLSQVWLDHTISYFDDTGGYDQRAYPWLGDLDGDGLPDLLCGSADGALYFYRGTGNRDRFTVSEGRTLLDQEGRTLALPGDYSAPTVLDVDLDGVPDIVSGAADGTLYWFRGLGELTYAPAGALLDCGLGQVQILPDAGDMDGDGVVDLLVGSMGGGLVIFYGDRTGGGLTFSRRRAVNLPEELRTWAAPCAADLDGDGVTDIALGTFDGYVARLVRSGNSYRLDGYLDGPEMNYKGNYHLKFGNNCKPAFGDVNGDDVTDLVCGSLEYGLACPIDSPYFPYREELQEQLDWMVEKNYYISSHSLSHAFASDGYEAREALRQRLAVESYGVDLSRTGTNQHTWHTSAQGPAQTFLNQYRQGLLWNSGAEMPGSEATPQVAAENVLSLPFLLEDGGEPSMLMLNASVLFYQRSQWETISARYGVPILFYYHCDMMYKDDTEARQAVQTAANFMAEQDYLCVREDQLAYASAAALNTRVSAGRDEEALRLSAETLREDLALYDERYQSAVGVKLTFADGLDAGDYTTDASVWRRMGNSLYLSLDKETVSVWRGETGSAHLRRVSLPADIRQEEGTVVVAFSEGGLMQAEAEGTVSTSSPGWTMTRTGENTLFTKYGEAEDLVLRLW